MRVLLNLNRDELQGVCTDDCKKDFFESSNLIVMFFFFSPQKKECLAPEHEF